MTGHEYTPGYIFGVTVLLCTGLSIIALTVKLLMVLFT